MSFPLTPLLQANHHHFQNPQMLNQLVNDSQYQKDFYLKSFQLGWLLTTGQHQVFHQDQKYHPEHLLHLRNKLLVKPLWVMVALERKYKIQLL